MKKLIFGFALMAMGSVALAQTTICNGGGTPAANVTGSVDGSLFVRATFAPTCGANTVMAYQQNVDRLWASAASTKGKNIFGASTNGGSVNVTGACHADGKTCGSPSDVDGLVKGTNGLAKAALLGNTN